MLQDHVTELPLAVLLTAHGLVLAGLTAMMIALSRRQKPRGWRLIAPSASHWFAVLGSWALSLLISWVWLFVGSARHDAAEQMRWAFLLASTFALGAAYVAFQISHLLRMGLRWRGDELVWSGKGCARQQSIRDCVDLGKRWTGHSRVRFADGATLDIDPYAAHATGLLALFAEQVTHNAFDDGSSRIR
ncbi:hypothetical protein [Erythrobacter sp. BLCC-B19]|uniref:hypothetical protein n=1 Tax=Erythrobacter sp. BLCC-B19 TaxID=3025315 RepID=UPI00235EA99C|nr:hypothetical protein [Erythrobacter sp. BLCC-B19]WDA42143.1 hypothetical protein PS060_04840 [Erythrobacter sp. BLCC-B19]